jgi:hypothetical protein
MSGDTPRDGDDGRASDDGDREPGLPAGLSELAALARVSSSRPLDPISSDVPPEVRDFAETMRVLFLALGMPLNRLAALLHSDPGTVSRYLSGKRVPPPDFIEGLLDHNRSKQSDLTGDTRLPVRSDIARINFPVAEFSRITRDNRRKGGRPSQAAYPRRQGGHFARTGERAGK